MLGCHGAQFYACCRKNHESKCDIKSEMNCSFRNVANILYFLFLKTLVNHFTIFQDFKTFGMQTFGNASVSVDTFFLMSGLLVSFFLLRELDRNKGKFNVGLYYLHRYLRLTIVYAFILGFIATLIVYVGTGPNWYSVNLYSNACRNAWWRQFLYSKFNF